MDFKSINLRRATGMVLLVSFSIVAASVLCLASAQANIMDNCSNPSGGATTCPFMSASIPAVINISDSIKQLVVVLAFTAALVATGLFLYNAKDKFGKLLIRMRQLERQRFQGKPVNTVLYLISQGILHPRIFAF
jgi:hypothetical protein